MYSRFSSVHCEERVRRIRPSVVHEKCSSRTAPNRSPGKQRCWTKSVFFFARTIHVLHQPRLAQQLQGSPLDLGQFDLGHSDLGQSALIRLRPEKILRTFGSTWANICGHAFLTELGHSGRRANPRKSDPEGWEAEGWGAPNVALFSPLLTQISFFPLSLYCCRGSRPRSTQSAHLGLSWVILCERPTRRRRCTQGPLRSSTHFGWTSSVNHDHISTNLEREETNEICAGREEQERNFGRSCGGAVERGGLHQCCCGGQHV